MTLNEQKLKLSEIKKRLDNFEDYYRLDDKHVTDVMGERLINIVYKEPVYVNGIKH